MLEDVLQPGLRVVFCGTAASARSALVMSYYAGQGNKFWRVLRETGLTPRQLSPSEYLLLPRFGIGLTDIVKGQAGPDKDIDFTRGGADQVCDKMLEFQPGVLCFNGKRAAREFLGLSRVEYGPRQERVGTTVLHVLPSTAGNANGYWDAAPWHAFAKLLETGSHQAYADAPRPGCA